MAMIGGVQPYNSSMNGYNVNGNYGAVNFGQLTTSTRQTQPVQFQQPYHQAYVPTTEDYEKALAFIESGSTSVNPYASKPIKTEAVDKNFEARGAAWNGFSVGANNGTGELSPTLTGREDAIAGVDWNNLYA